MLYALNLYSDICQLFLNKMGKNKLKRKKNNENICRSLSRHGKYKAAIYELKEVQFFKSSLQ